jgi:hypothetical protein
MVLKFRPQRIRKDLRLYKAEKLQSLKTAYCRIPQLTQILSHKCLRRRGPKLHHKANLVMVSLCTWDGKDYEYSKSVIVSLNVLNPNERYTYLNCAIVPNGSKELGVVRAPFHGSDSGQRCVDAINVSIQKHFLRSC